MEYFWWLYLATRLDAIQGTFHGMVAISLAALGLIAFITFLCTIDNGEFSDNWKVSRGYRYFAMVCLIVGVFGSALTPSKKDAMFIAGGVGVIEATKAVAGSKIAQTSVKIVEEWLDKELADIKAKSDAKKADKNS